MKRSTLPAPSDEEILAFQNVPVATAAKYIGWSSSTLTYALQGRMERRSPVPFGFATETKTGGWAYNICPRALVRYHHGETPLLGIDAIQETVVDGVERLLAAALARQLA